MRAHYFAIGLLGLATLVIADNYFTIALHAPKNPMLHGKLVNARDKSFIAGAPTPSTRCGLDDAAQCPTGNVTLVTRDMSFLASAVPGGQFIYIAPDGSISYPNAHSTLRPPGAQVGGFYSLLASSDHSESVDVLNWRSTKDGTSGLWVCAVAPGAPIAYQAVLKASTGQFNGLGCLSVNGIVIQEAGSSFGAWEYT
ncbi:uncharacterized protein TRIREDRAFT_70806 [Trichoderma reesei QM6a]|uniref:Predicted protein n=2 Tax=Hypocrea jecorina TaxID=51453 RepID=G0RX59_HYPJQ|nr:uncharacterized protein TRIREDRAFT_70806 [Trichoderma reesei QM6a]EGR44238.1 predicted protein [Trichoderma reesei QM6a]ETR96868.1 hypothetical protein M419DRAFT_135026 [Trichoderma reesei RUT C-30]